MTSEQVERVFAIADLSGYTALTETHGNVHAAQTVTRYAEITQAVLQPGVRLVERVGDEVVIAAADVASVVLSAIKLREAVENEPFFPAIRSGIHAGWVVQQGHTYCGSALNLTARVAGYARGGQILCTHEVTALAGALDDVEFRALGPVRFKNILDPVAVYEIVAGQRSSENTVIDPVCRMQVRPDAAPARLPFADQTYYFCSFECAQAFATRPEQYAPVGAQR